MREMLVVGGQESGYAAAFLAAIRLATEHIPLKPTGNKTFSQINRSVAFHEKRRPVLVKNWHPNGQMVRVILDVVRGPIKLLKNGVGRRYYWIPLSMKNELRIDRSKF